MSTPHIVHRLEGFLNISGREVRPLEAIIAPNGRDAVVLFETTAADSNPFERFALVSERDTVETYYRSEEWFSQMKRVWKGRLWRADEG